MCEVTTNMYILDDDEANNVLRVSFQTAMHGNSKTKNSSKRGRCALHKKRFMAVEIWLALQHTTTGASF